MKYYLKAYGCKVNQYEAEVRRQALKKEYTETKKPEEADLVFFFSCSVTEKAGLEPIREANKLFKKNKKSRIIFTGCLGENEKGKISDLYSRNQNISIEEKSIDINDTINGFDGHSRAFIKIQDGCNNYCTYCVVPYLRNKVVSKSSCIILNEIETLCKNKSYNEFVLTGTHLGQYSDNENYGLAELILGIENRFPDIRLRLSSIELNELNVQLLSVLEKSRIILPHFHIPLQSGSDKVLKAMNRKYTVLEYREKVNLIRRIIPGINITTDVIVGFPAEMEKDFEETCDFVKDLKLGWLHIFPFSERKETKIGMKYGLLPGGVIKDRVKILRKIDRILRNDFVRGLNNKILKVLIEKKENNYYFSTADNYIKVIFDSVREFKNGETAEVRITGAVENNCFLYAKGILCR